MTFIDKLLSIIYRKDAPSGGGSVGTPYYGFLDAFKSKRKPRPLDLLESYKNIAYSCAQLNAKGVASVRLRLLHKRPKGSRPPKNFPGRDLDYVREDYFREKSPGIAPILASDVDIREISQHPILDMLQNPNPFHSRFNLMEWTTLSQDIMGDAYWSFSYNDYGLPCKIWPLPAHLMVPIPSYVPGEILLNYQYGGADGQTIYPPEEIIHFKYIGLGNPYLFGYSPLQAAFEQVNIADKFLAYQEAVLDNRARPDMIISPKDVIGKDEAKRLERKFQQQFRGGGSGGIVVAESGFDYKSMTFSPTDLATMEIRKVSKEEIANAFGVPHSMLSMRDVNRSSAEAGHYEHAKQAILPRCQRIEEFLNMKLCPLFDPNIFLAFDNPVIADEAERRETRRVNILTGVHTINEERRVDGLPDIEGGDTAYMPSNYAPIHMLQAQAQSIIDRNTTDHTAIPGEVSVPNHPADNTGK